jgi:hypothetical protein
MTDEASLPQQDCDILTGIAQIAAWLGLTVGQCRPRIESRVIPTYRLTGKPTVYALKSEIIANAKAASEQYRRRVAQRHNASVTAS